MPSTDRSAAAPTVEAADSEPKKPLTPAAERALAEAAERRSVRDAEAARAKKAAELGGQPGPDPVRYGDWEKAGIVSDF